MRNLRKVLLCFNLVVAIVLIILLRSNVYFDNVGFASAPVCIDDKHTFKEGICEGCGKPIKQKGIFVNRATGEYISFNTYYVNFKDYERDKRYCDIFVVCFCIVLLGLFAIVCSFLLDKRGKFEEE